MLPQVQKSAKNQERVGKDKGVLSDKFFGNFQLLLQLAIIIHNLNDREVFKILWEIKYVRKGRSSA
jgi:hypothetical protein